MATRIYTDELVSRLVVLYKSNSMQVAWKKLAKEYSTINAAKWNTGHSLMHRHRMDLRKDADGRYYSLKKDAVRLRGEGMKASEIQKIFAKKHKGKYLPSIQQIVFWIRNGVDKKGVAKKDVAKNDVGKKDRFVMKTLIFSNDKFKVEVSVPKTEAAAFVRDVLDV